MKLVSFCFILCEMWVIQGVSHVIWLLFLPLLSLLSLSRHDHLTSDRRPLPLRLTSHRAHCRSLLPSSIHRHSHATPIESTRLHSITDTDTDTHSVTHAATASQRSSMSDASGASDAAARTQSDAAHSSNKHTPSSGGDDAPSPLSPARACLALTAALVPALLVWLGARSLDASIPGANATAALVFAINLVGWAHGSALRTERCYDLLGTGSFASATIFSLWRSRVWGQSDSSLWSRQLLLSALVLLWAVRLGSHLVVRVFKAGEDRRFRVAKQSPIRYLVSSTHAHTRAATVAVTVAAAALSTCIAHGIAEGAVLSGFGCVTPVFFCFFFCLCICSRAPAVLLCHCCPFVCLIADSSGLLVRSGHVVSAGRRPRLSRQSAA